jgi:hypothetical protein
MQCIVHQGWRENIRVPWAEWPFSPSFSVALISGSVGHLLQGQREGGANLGVIQMSDSTHSDWVPTVGLESKSIEGRIPRSREGDPSR